MRCTPAAAAGPSRPSAAAGRRVDRTQLAARFVGAAYNVLRQSRPLQPDRRAHARPSTPAPRRGTYAQGERVPRGAFFDSLPDRRMRPLDRDRIAQDESSILAAKCSEALMARSAELLREHCIIGSHLSDLRATVLS